MSEIAWHASVYRLEAAIVRLRGALAVENVRTKARRFLEIYKANFDPNQPRVPAGSSEGGQWTSEGGADAVRLAASDKTPRVRAGRVGIVLDAARQLIDTFRDDNYLRDLLGEDVGTVAVTSLDDQYLYGFNSGISEYSGQYTDRDGNAADELRGRMLEKYPRVMAIGNVGAKPNDALYHAEATVLLRAARENGGSLAEKNLIVVVDKPLCRSCRRLLPLVGIELGNPTVTFVSPKGSSRTMRDGKWITAGDK
jgi:hypothetical protein